MHSKIQQRNICRFTTKEKSIPVQKLKNIFNEWTLKTFEKAHEITFLPPLDTKKFCPERTLNIRAFLSIPTHI